MRNHHRVTAYTERRASAPGVGLELLGCFAGDLVENIK